MSKTTYTDNTSATDPPGGKRHTVEIHARDTLPPKQQSKRAKSKPVRAPARKAAAKTKTAAKKTAAKKTRR